MLIYCRRRLVYWQLTYQTAETGFKSDSEKVIFFDSLCLLKELLIRELVKDMLYIGNFVFTIKLIITACTWHHQAV